MSNETDPVREHLDKAENWLALAEGNRGELVSLHEGTGTYTEAEDAQRWYFATMLESAKDLAELHRAMAQTINDLTPQRYVLDSTIDVGRAVREQITAENADYVAAMEKRLGEQLKADDEEHQAVTLRPGVDPEPEAEGELWTTGDGWFYYAVSAIPAEEAAGPGAGYVEKSRWFQARHYAQVLRWQSEQGVKRIPLTWAELRDESLTATPPDTVLRRPTAEERATFYGPEPDPQPAIEETHERTTTIPPAPVAWFPEDDVTMKAWLRGLDPKQLNRLLAAASNERTERLYAE